MLIPNSLHASTPIAAIDIGSNSIHLLVAQVDKQGHITILDSDKTILRLGEAIDENKNLSDTAIHKTISAIKQMKEIASFYNPVYRAVATHAVRKAKNNHELFAKIYEETKIPVSLIEGEEEARLVALGMRSGLPLEDKIFIGVDIGGGSSEIVISKNEQILYTASIDLGAVVLNKRFFTDAKIRSSHIKKLKQEIALKIAPLHDEINAFKIDHAVFCSGVAKAFAYMHSQENRKEKLEDPNGYYLKAPDINELCLSIQKQRSREKIHQKWDLELNRAELMLSASCIFKEISSLLPKMTWTVSTHGLREGIILDTFSRLHGPQMHGIKDVRWRNIIKLGEKYKIDENQAKNVSELALKIYSDLRFTRPKYIERVEGEVVLAAQGILKAAAWLHECGKFMTYSKFHKHSRYLISNSRLLGFSQKERKLISLVAQYQRKGKAQKKHHECLGMRSKELKYVNYLAAILRIAAAANRSRQGLIKSCDIKQDENKIQMNFLLLKDSEAELDMCKINREKVFLEEIIGLPLIIEGLVKEEHTKA